METDLKRETVNLLHKHSRPPLKVSMISFVVWSALFLLWVRSLLVTTMTLLLSRTKTRYQIKKGMNQLRKLHTDNCSCPAFPFFLGSIVGVGSQTIILVCSLFLMDFGGFFNICNPDELIPFLLYAYFLTSVVSGYIAVSFHCRFKRVMLHKIRFFKAQVLHFVPAFLILLAYDLDGLSDGFSSRVKLEGVLIVWGLATSIGLWLDTRFADKLQDKSRLRCITVRVGHSSTKTTTNQNWLPWYREFPQVSYHTILGGLLPFIVVLPFMDTVLASLWQYQFCGAISSLTIPLILVVSMTTVISIYLTIVQLRNNDNSWWWRSVSRAGVTAISMFLYGLYFYAYAGRGHGLMKLLFFFEYNMCIFYGVFVMMAAVGLYASYSTVYFMFPESCI